MRTRATRVDDGWRINGQKVFISGALEAEEMLLIARTDPLDEGNPTGGLSIFIVDMSLPGITLRQQRISSVAPTSQCEVFLDDLVVPPDALVGEAGRGIVSLFSALNPERVLAASMALGLGNHVLNRGVEYAKTRAPFGTPIGAYQGIAHPMAKAKIHLDAARLATYEAARGFDRGEDVALLANSAKFLASEGAGLAMDITIQAHGGYAFDADYDLVGFVEPLRLLRVAPLNNEMILNFVAERGLGLPRSY
jgi:acyl-CoA dehydrogenase